MKKVPSVTEWLLRDRSTGAAVGEAETRLGMRSSEHTKRPAPLPVRYCRRVRIVLCLRNAFSLESTDVHEITVALSLLEGVQATALQQGIDRVSAVHIRVGALSGVVRDALLFSWDVATAETVAEGSTLRIEEIPLVVFCERCEGERAPRPGTGLVCPECGTPSPRILRGREMQLVAMEVPA